MPKYLYLFSVIGLQVLKLFTCTHTYTYMVTKFKSKSILLQFIGIIRNIISNSADVTAIVFKNC